MNYISFLKKPVINDVITMRTLVSKFSDTLSLPETKFFCNRSHSFFRLPIPIQLKTCLTHWTLSYWILLFLWILIKNRRNILGIINTCYSMRMSRKYLSSHSLNFISWFLRLFNFISRCKRICGFKFNFIGFIIEFCIFLTS